MELGVVVRPRPDPEVVEADVEDRRATWDQRLDLARRAVELLRPLAHVLDVDEEHAVAFGQELHRHRVRMAVREVEPPAGVDHAGAEQLGERGQLRECVRVATGVARDDERPLGGAETLGQPP